MTETMRAFGETFGYLVKNGVTFDNLEFDEADTKLFLAERYGGFGIGYNGGGARCGSLGPFQVKGCGKNLLAGADQDVHHSYGGFKALYAAHEAIYGSILEGILPLGAVRILGIILTGADGAYVLKDVERGWGALMIRDAVLRPANFLRARSFHPTKEASRILFSDVGRVRKVNRDLHRLLGGADGFDSYIKRFLRNSANQFSFARLARLSHGAVTASNIAVDGRWLDLTNTSFSCSSINTGGDNIFSPSFYEELYSPISIACELIDTFAKYNNLTIASDWVDAFYKGQVNFYISTHLPYLFGQALRWPVERGPQPAPTLAAAVMRILSSAPTVHHRWPRALQPEDPIVCLIESLFLALGGASTSRLALLEQIKISPHEMQQLLEEFTCMLRKFQAGLPATTEWGAFLRQSYVRAIRRACLVEYFFKQRLSDAIEAHLRSPNEGELGAFISASVKFGRWALAAPPEDDMLFSSPNCTLRFLSDNYQLILRTPDGETQGKAIEILRIIEALPQRYLTTEGFDCAPYVSRVLKGLTVLEQATLL